MTESTAAASTAATTAGAMAATAGGPPADGSEGYSPLLPLAQAPDHLELVKERWNAGVHDVVGDDGNSYARLDYKLWSGDCRAETTDVAYRFARPKGLFKSTITVESGTGEPVGDLDLGIWSGGGTFSLRGVDYTISDRGLLSPGVTITLGDEVLFTLKQTSAFGKKKAKIEITPAGRTSPDATLLLLLGLDLVLVQEHGGGGGWV